jgi:hypothetical protein
MTKGRKSAYKRKQVLRLIRIFDDIFCHESTSRIDAIGRRQIIGYWRRHEHESYKTRMEKYHILTKFFASYEKTQHVTVPKPNRLSDRE